MDRKPLVALVLGSGGARGYAHIGVIDVLIERGYEVVAVAGSSMGAIVGGIFAAGKLDDYRDWVTGIGQFEMLRLIDLSLSRPGLRADKVFGRVRALVGDVVIEELPIRFTAVAVDLMARREVWFQEGSLDLALRASGANPSLFSPVEHEGRILVDGGLLNPLPIAPTAAAAVDLVIAVSLHGEAIPAQPPVEPDDPAFIDRIRSRTSRAVDREIRALLRPHTQTNGDGAPTEEPPPRRPARSALSKFDLLQLSLETMQSALSEHKLSGYRPDVLVNIPRNACRSLDFHRAKELIALGRALADDALDQTLTRR